MRGFCRQTGLKVLKELFICVRSVLFDFRVSTLAPIKPNSANYTTAFGSFRRGRWIKI